MPQQVSSVQFEVPHQSARRLPQSRMADYQILHSSLASGNPTVALPKFGPELGQLALAFAVHLAWSAYSLTKRSASS
ncbi:hypothetical protein JCM16303_000139 [Sporobolomyces ruberrimus]